MDSQTREALESVAMAAEKLAKAMQELAKAAKQAEEKVADAGQNQELSCTNARIEQSYQYPDHRVGFGIMEPRA